MYNLCKTYNFIEDNLNELENDNDGLCAETICNNRLNENKRNLLWGIVAYQINSSAPNCSPDIHIMAGVDCTAYSVGSGPNHLKK